jgi:dUTP pyrophosphatase
MTILKIKKLDNLGDLPLPKYETSGSAGMDLIAAIEEPITIKPSEIKLVKTGIAIALEKGFEAQVRPRSGLALKNGITVLNSPGTVDSDYRGEVCAILINHSQVDFVITRGMRIAQMVIAKHEQAKIIEVADLDETARGTGGFGSTGLKTTA